MGIRKFVIRHYILETRLIRHYLLGLGSCQATVGSISLGRTIVIRKCGAGVGGMERKRGRDRARASERERERGGVGAAPSVSYNSIVGAEEECEQRRRRTGRRTRRRRDRSLRNGNFPHWGGPLVSECGRGRKRQRQKQLQG